MMTLDPPLNAWHHVLGDPMGIAGMVGMVLVGVMFCAARPRLTQKPRLDIE